MIKRGFLILRLAAALLPLSVSCASQTISFTYVPEGYSVASLDLPRAFAGALAVHPELPHLVYASVGDYGDNQLVEVNLAAGTSRVVAAGPFGSISGIACLSSRRLVLVDNAGAGGDPTYEGIFLASDNNPRDGDFDDAGEITPLIEPILTEGDFAGSQARVMTYDHPTIPRGSVLIQTADGGGLGDLLVVADPLTSPAYIPAGSAFFTGFDYNGGFDFDPDGRIYLGTATSSFSGLVHALEDQDLDGRIGGGESHVLVDTAGLPLGIADLSMDGEGDVFCASLNSILTFRLPASPMTQTATPSTFAVTDAGFLSGLLLTAKWGSFESGATGTAPSLLCGGWTGSLEAAKNLLVLTPSGGADGGPFADRVVSTAVGAGQDAAFDDPEFVIGPPHAYDDVGIGGSTHVYNLGHGGVITVEFTGKVIYDGPGVDFTVFENPFYISGSFESVFLEAGRVAVSSDGISFATFPVDYVAPEPPPAFDSDPAHYVGFAGVRPVFSSPENGIDPLDPAVSGGDPFDLTEIAATAAAAGVDVNSIRFIRITDVIAGTDDDDGDPIPETSVVGQNGFDLDAIAGINMRAPEASASVAERTWELYR